MAVGDTGPCGARPVEVAARDASGSAVPTAAVSGVDESVPPVQLTLAATSTASTRETQRLFILDRRLHPHPA